MMDVLQVDRWSLGRPSAGRKTHLVDHRQRDAHREDGDHREGDGRVGDETVRLDSILKIHDNACRWGSAPFAREHCSARCSSTRLYSRGGVASLCVARLLFYNLIIDVDAVAAAAAVVLRLFLLALARPPASPPACLPACCRWRR